MNTIAITAMREGTGKTACTIALGLLAQERGMRVGYMKPKGTRLESHVGKVLDHDPLLAAELLELDADIEDMEPIVYSPTFVENAVRGHANPGELALQVKETFERLSADCDLLLIEGAGRLEMGAIIDLSDPDIAALLDARVVLVSEFEDFGDLDHILQASEAFGNRLSGILFNRVRDRAMERLEQDGIPFLERRNRRVHGVIPHDRELAGVKIPELADELGARRLTAPTADAFVERVLVGAMGGEAALRHFRRSRNTAVITGGDRSEIHAAAIEAPGISCLIVTGGMRPAGGVLGRAETEGLAVLAVDADTLSTVERAEAIVRGGRTRDPETVEKMTIYLDDHVDIDELIDA